MLHVDAGGSVTAEGCTLRSVAGPDSPFPCDGALPACTGPHAGPVELAGVAEVRTESPLVCDVATGACNSVTCPELEGDVASTTPREPSGPWRAASRGSRSRAVPVA